MRASALAMAFACAAGLLSFVLLIDRAHSQAAQQGAQGAATAPAVAPVPAAGDADATLKVIQDAIDKLQKQVEKFKDDKATPADKAALETKALALRKALQEKLIAPANVVANDAETFKDKLAKQLQTLTELIANTAVARTQLGDALEKDEKLKKARTDFSTAYAALTEDSKIHILEAKAGDINVIQTATDVAKVIDADITDAATGEKKTLRVQVYKAKPIASKRRPQSLRYCDAFNAVRSRCEGNPLCALVAKTDKPAQIDWNLLCGYDPVPLAEDRIKGVEIKFVCIRGTKETWEKVAEYPGNDPATGKAWAPTRINTVLLQSPGMQVRCPYPVPEQTPEVKK